jgi:hypothetical protein
MRLSQHTTIAHTVLGCLVGEVELKGFAVKCRGWALTTSERRTIITANQPGVVASRFIWEISHKSNRTASRTCLADLTTSSRQLEEARDKPGVFRVNQENH